MHSTKPFTSLSLLITMLFVSFIGLFQFITSTYVLSLDWLIIFTTILVMNFMSVSKNFIFMISITLFIGFFLLFHAFFSGSTLGEQANYIIQHVLLTASLFLIWLIFNQIKKSQEEVKSLKDRVSELEKFEGSSNLLTTAEFISRASLISTGTKRRGEENYYILFSVTHMENTKESMNYLFADAMFKTIRAQYDLATNLRNDSFLVFLQNTNEDGCYIVVERLFNILRSQLNLIEIPVSYEVINEDDMNGLKKRNEMKEPEFV